MYAAAGLFAVFCAAQASALMRGRGGRAVRLLRRARDASAARRWAAPRCWRSRSRPCRCCRARTLTTEEWLGVGLGAALVRILGLGVALLALARELGTLRMSIAPQGALEIPSEGPEVGGRTALAERVRAARRGRAGARGVHLRGVPHLPARSSPPSPPSSATRAWSCAASTRSRTPTRGRLADVPGSPFAVALGEDGTVLAKGTFNSGAQLESVLATAERRRGALSA